MELDCSSEIPIYFSQVEFHEFSFSQGGLNQKEAQLNLCSIFSILLFKVNQLL